MNRPVLIIIIAMIGVGIYATHAFFFEKDYLIFQYLDNGAILEQEQEIPDCREQAGGCAPLEECSGEKCWIVTCDSDEPAWAIDLLECDAVSEIDAETESPIQEDQREESGTSTEQVSEPVIEAQET